MVKIDMFCSNEQYNNCSNLLIKADDPPLEELDPAILSCGLPAIVLTDTQPPVFSTPPIRYSFSQLQALRKSTLSFRRPKEADDPRVSRFNIWKSKGQLKRASMYVQTTSRKADRDDHVKGPITVKDTAQDRPAMQKNYLRENGFVAPRYRRNYEFSNRNHHVIVKSYRSDEHRLQEAVIEEEPEWMSGGPTSRLDTIELRGFDEDTSINALSTSSSSLEKATSAKSSSNNSREKHISFYDELHHYEHVHPKRGSSLPKHDSSGRENDGESLTVTCTSNTSSPPPARSTPTKAVTSDFSDHSSNEKLGENPSKSYQSAQNGGVNVTNFEEFLKFDSFLSTDSVPGTNSQNDSRFSKLSRRGNSPFNQQVGGGSSFDGRRQLQHANSDNSNHSFGNNRFQFDRTGFQNHRGPGVTYNQNFVPELQDQNSNVIANTTNAFKQLVDIVAHNHVSNNLLAQKQYLAHLLSKSQQTDALRKMLMKAGTDNPPRQSQPLRIPTQRELQFHTQTIMQNALLRKKLQDQRKMLYEQTNQLNLKAATAGELNPAVQNFVQSVCPNMQRSLSVLSQAIPSASQCRQQYGGQSYGVGDTAASGHAPIFSGGPSQQELSSSLQQLLFSQRQSGGGHRRLSKGSVTWNNGN